MPPQKGQSYGPRVRNRARLARILALSLTLDVLDEVADAWSLALHYRVFGDEVPTIVWQTVRRYNRATVQAFGWPPRGRSPGVPALRAQREQLTPALVTALAAEEAIERTAWDQAYRGRDAHATPQP